MDFNTWVRAKGFDPDTLTPEQRAFFQATWRAEVKAAANPTPSPAPAPTAGGAGNEPPSPAPRPAPEPTGALPNPQSTFDQKIAAIEAENQRQEYIRAATLRAMEANVGNPEKTKQIRELGQHALSDQKVTQRDFDLSLLRVDRFSGPIILAPTEPALNERVLEAAICVTQKLKDVEKKFDDRTLQAAHSHFRRGIGLKELLMIAAKQNNGYRGSDRDVGALCKAAFRTGGWGDGYGPMAGSIGPSVIAVPGILANVANKFLAAGFLYGEQSWRGIARVKPASDFKQMTTYRLTGANKFEKVAPGGELKHGTLSELTYTNQVDTYGKMLGLDRRDIRNDDLGAFTGASDELGRGAIDSLNEVFWTEWLDDSTFFPTDKSKNNYDDGATDSVLSLAGLDNANQIFGAQTKPDGTPMGIMPRILLVPLALWATAKNLMSGAVTAAAQSTATVTTENIWKGMFDVVSSVYLQNSTITGNSATAWYLLADPANVAAIEVAFLDGMESPIVETSEFDFDRLGIAMRAYMDWGCSLMEYRAGVKLKGAA